MQLKELTCGATARIIGLNPGDPIYRQQLLAMGLLPGTKVTIMRIAPLGDPIEITVRGVALSLRKHEADILQLEEV